MSSPTLIRRGVLLLAALLALGVVESAAAPYRVYDVRFGGEAPPPLGAGPSDAELINAAAWLMSNRLGLPFPDGTKVYVYVNQATLVDGLVELTGATREAAWEMGRFAGAVATRVGVLVRGDRLAAVHVQARAGLFAHELTHVSQRKLWEGGRGRPAQWILEGHADWVKFQVFELLGFQTYRRSLDDVVRSITGSPTGVKFFPDLDALAGSARWTATRNELGAPATYGQAFLAVDSLVERYGAAKLLEFLGRFAQDTDPRTHWGAVFPIPYREFAAEFRARLEGLR